MGTKGEKMQKNIIGFMLLTFLLSNSLASSQKSALQETEENYIQIIILDKGVKRKIYIPKDDTLKNKFNPHTAKQLSTKDGIIISFKDPVQIPMSEFEAKYGLKLQKKLLIGYYIFQNISGYSDIQIVGKIIKNEPNVKTVKPNWKKKNSPR
jgi:hypothetical protein